MNEVRGKKVYCGELLHNSFSRCTKIVKFVKKNWEIFNLQVLLISYDISTYIIMHHKKTAYLKKQSR